VNTQISKEYKKYLKNIKLKNLLILSTQIGLLIIIIAIWEILAKYNIIDTFIMSSPSRIIATIADLYSNGNLFYHIFTIFVDGIDFRCV